MKKTTQLLSVLLLIHLPFFSQNIFTYPNPVCVNETVNLQNTSLHGAYYSWNFCAPNVNNPATAVSIGNPGGMMNVNTFSDIVVDHSTGNYHMFVTNYFSSNIIRLDFGNSPLNNPTATNLGTFGMLPSELEGIQIAKDGITWYGFAVGGHNSNPKLVRLNFGTNLTNIPTATDLGNIGNMMWPTEYQLVNENGSWFGLVANRSTSTISVHNFGTNLGNIPSGSSYKIQSPNSGGSCNLMAIKDGGNWHVFVTCLFNAFVRLDYGNSLLNIPTETDFGTLNGALQALPRGIVILKDCNQYVGYLGHENGITLKLNFNSGLTGTPTVTNSSNISGIYQKVHEFTPITYNGNLYMFTADYATNTLQRMQINLCNGTPASSNSINPPAYSYNTSGTYDITLLVDEGRGIPQIQCSKINVLDKVTITKYDTICTGADYTLPGGGIVNVAGTYYDTLASAIACDSVIITNLAVIPLNPPIIPEFTVSPNSSSLLENTPFIFTNNSTNANSWIWNFGDGNTSFDQNPSHVYADTGLFCITLTAINMPSGCKDTTTKCVKVEGDWSFYIPNAFTPNSDGKNDFFSGKGFGIKKYKMLIFDRWGNMIFETTDLNKGWDGKTKNRNEKSLMDVYVYKIELTDFKGQEHQYIGHFSLIR